MKKTIIIIIALLTFMQLNGQNFFLINYDVIGVKPDTIIVENITKGTSLMMSFEDTLKLVDVTKIEENRSFKNQLFLYPNPTNNVLNFEFEHNIYGKVCFIINNILGNTIYKTERELPQGNYHYQLSGLPTGTYIFTIQTTYGKISERFISTNQKSESIELSQIGELHFTKRGVNPDMNETSPKNNKGIFSMDFSMGDQLRFIAITLGIDNDTVDLSPTAGQTVSFELQTTTFMYNGEVVTYGIVERNYDSKLGPVYWLDRNLGALQVATNKNDYLAYGDLFQWGRAADGHEIINWTSASSGSPLGSPLYSTTSGPCNSVNTDTVPHSYFIKCNTHPYYDWRYPQNPNLWQGVNGINNPCPTGWRLPTQEELNTEVQTWTGITPVAAFNSALKIPSAGLRIDTNGSLMSNGIICIWTSTTDVTGSIHLSNSGFFPYSRAFGMSVRCIKE